MLSTVRWLARGRNRVAPLDGSTETAVPDPASMSLLAAHQVFIASVIALLALCVLWEVSAYRDGGDAWTLLYALIAAVAAMLLTLYLRTLRRRGRLSPYRRNQSPRA